jgi:hypothetical protein
MFFNYNGTIINIDESDIEKIYLNSIEKGIDHTTFPFKPIFKWYVCIRKKNKKWWQFDMEIPVENREMGQIIIQKINQNLKAVIL